MIETARSRIDADLTLRAALYGVLFQACADMVFIIAYLF